ncbi:RidA family protein [Burkholderia cepacia]|uniref:RidA family protein n=1 Tax=Burkholderia cepacia TaxID=292 RepID=A0A8I1AYC2_BURCE|nr:RidA family protein [Burkholderia cepacia]MBA9900888.1 RidA family protein [Burkholderia cepacia]MBA9947849.1 RidA family protein [Burkholderia cepacia]MBA9978039.1 RidA family protein [Burkholderia cepacia]MBA9996848.1 RidA family protein [Burkholderia cepacia]MBB0004662.1 RidA family protein [Burkholderia cepacia]
MRKRISTGSPWEPKVGYSRAVVVDNTIYISGTAGKGADVYAQARDALATIDRVLADSGFSLSDVVQSRLVVADFDNWEAAARAHGEIYGDIRPAFSLVHALPFVDPEILVEVEAIAVRPAA